MLVVNPFGIGDVIFSTPLVAALKAIHPDSSIGYVCNKRAAEVIRSNPDVSRLFVYEKDDFRSQLGASKLEGIRKIWRFLKAIKAERFDIMIDLSLNYQCSMLLALIGVRRRYGLNYRDRGRFLTGKIDIDGFGDKHVVEHYLDILTLLGVDPANHRARARVFLTEADRTWAEQFLSQNGVGPNDVLVAVIPGCGASWGRDASRRRWSAERFSKVCDALIDKRGVKVILLGDVREATLCETVQKGMKHKAIMACGRTTIGDFLGLISRCDVVLTNDGGPLHMAVAAGVRTVSIFGPVDEKTYGPYPIGRDHVVISRKDVPCRPCYRKFKYADCTHRQCLEKITVEEVLGAVEKALTA